MRLADPGFIIPFKYNHCVVTAFTAVQRQPTTEFALGLARSAMACPHPLLLDTPLLTARGGSPATIRSYETWAALAGLQVVEVFEPATKWDGQAYTDRFGEYRWRSREVGAPTVAGFARTHRTGRWVVLTNRHAQAVVDGKVRGWYGARSRVIAAWRVDDLPKLDWQPAIVPSPNTGESK